MDGANPAVRLCVDGMAAEARGQPAEALRLFAEAWSASADDFEACIAAHYVARHQPTVELALHWNAEALQRADAAAAERVREFYPSLHLNLGHSFERLGDLRAARGHYHCAAARLADLPEDGYFNFVRAAVAKGLERTRARPAARDAAPVLDP